VINLFFLGSRLPELGEESEMITHFWAVGIAFTIFIFAGKAGLVAGTTNIRVLKILGLALIYGALAFLMGVILNVFNPLDYFQFFQKFMSYGVLLHLFLSLGLLAWGVYTIKSYVNQKLDRMSKTGYLLMFPCPVCLSAMILSCSIFVAITSIDPLKAGGLMALLFMVVIAGVALLTRRVMRANKEGVPGPVLLGFVMMLVGLYFAVSVIVVPVYSQSKVFFSTASNIVPPSLSLNEAVVILAVSALFFSLGFFKN
jgi:predicted transporter